MSQRIGLVLLGGLLVSAGCFLAQVPRWTGAAQADIVASAPGVLVTSDASTPGRIYVWQLNGGQVVGVTTHTDTGEGQVQSKDLRLVHIPRVR